MSALATAADTTAITRPSAWEASQSPVRWMSSASDSPPCGFAVAERWIAERRASDEGQEGLRAFLDKRKPDWK